MYVEAGQLGLASRLRHNLGNIGNPKNQVPQRRDQCQPRVPKRLIVSHDQDVLKEFRHGGLQGGDAGEGLAVIAASRSIPDPGSTGINLGPEGPLRWFDKPRLNRRPVSRIAHALRNVLHALQQRRHAEQRL